MEGLLPRISTTTAATSKISKPVSCLSITSQTSSPSTTSNVEEEYADSNQFRLSYYPHTLEGFSNLCKNAFGPRAKHTVYADFKPLNVEPEPSFYIHVVEKPL